MQQGIGRAGFTLLALVTFAIGAFGFALTWTAFDQGAGLFFRMGLGVAAVALFALFLFAAFKPTSASTPAPRAPPATNKAVPQEASTDLGFEFGDYEPAAKAAPEKMVLPDAFQDKTPPAPQAAPEPVSFKPVSKSLDATIEQVVETARPKPQPVSVPKDPAAWPGARGKSAWSNQVDHRRKVESQVDDSRRRHEFAEKYTRTTPTLRAILDDGKAGGAQSEVPEKLADRAPGDMNTDFVAPGMSIGQCGQCRTLLLAPEERPLRLKCPECAKVTLLQ